MTPNRGALICAFIALIPFTLKLADCVSVMSVDFGSEWMKVAIVSPGVPMEIALNKESKRKTPAFIAFRDGERTFGEDAQNIAVRFPSNGYGYLLDLLGKKIDNPIVQLFKSRFPWYNIIEDPERNTVLFQHNSETTYSPEELIGMLLFKAKEFAEESVGQTITDSVLVVPGFFNQAERQAFLTAANLGGIKVLQLINDYTAVALNYGIFRRKDFNETTQYIMFYDMGASSTSVSLVSYQTVRIKDRGIIDTHPQATILGVGYDRTLGGLEMQLRLQKYLAEKFNQVKKTKNDVFNNPRAMAKLFKEAGRLKNVLSANVEHFAQVEGLLDEEDFKVKVTREEFEGLCKDLFDRVGGPVKQALDNAGVTMDIVNQIILVGAGTRVPKIQETLSKIVKMELSKNINTDEAAVMGAVYKAADISTGFKVKKFITKDAVLFPIQVSYQRESDSGEVKQQTRTLFGPMNAFPQKKMITFSKYTKDFNFNVHYGDLGHLPENEIKALGPQKISEVTLTGVADAVAKHAGENVDPKGIKAHFNLDDSGILNLTSVDYVVEKTGGEEPSTLQKIGSGLSKLFGGSDSSVEDKATESDGNQSSESATEEKTDQASPKNDTNASENATKTDEATQAPKNETEKVEKPKIVTVKEEIKRTIQHLGIKSTSEKAFEVSLKKLGDMNEFDKQKQRKEQARNQLESFVFDVQNKFELDQYVEAATEDEKNSITEACSQIVNWLDDEGYDADAVTYEDKFSQLKSLTGPLFRRVKEHSDRPEALNALQSKLEAAGAFATTIREKTKEALDAGEETIFTTVEIDVLDKVIAETKEWKQKMEAEQKPLPLSVAPVLTLRSIVDKLKELDREVNYLMNKAKIWRPTKKVNETKAEAKTSTNGTNESVKNKTQEEPIVINLNENKTTEEKISGENQTKKEESSSEGQKEEETVDTQRENDDSENHQEL